MKNLFLILTLILFITGCGQGDKKAAEHSADTPKGESKNSDTFNQSFEKLLASYYSLKDALVEYDTVKANHASVELGQYAETLPVTEIRNDSLGVIKETAKSYTGTITGSAIALAAEQDLVQKKREFQMISDAMYNLVRAVHYDKEKIYYQHCPMAFGDEEAYWLSNDRQIVNPYLGKQHPKYKGGMVHCGDITDSIDFSH